MKWGMHDNYKRWNFQKREKERKKKSGVQLKNNVINLWLHWMTNAVSLVKEAAISLEEITNDVVLGTSFPCASRVGEVCSAFQAWRASLFVMGLALIMGLSIGLTMCRPDFSRLRWFVSLSDDWAWTSSPDLNSLLIFFL